VHPVLLIAPSTDQLVCKQEVTGSIPVGSTQLNPCRRPTKRDFCRGETPKPSVLGITIGHQTPRTYGTEGRRFESCRGHYCDESDMCLR